MKKAFRYIGAFCLIAIALVVLLCLISFYQSFQIINGILQGGADNYTCRQFNYDISQKETDKFPAMVISAIAYGYVSDDKTANKVAQTEMEGQGVAPALRKVAALCEKNENERVINLFVQTTIPLPVSSKSVSGTAATASGTIPSPTTPQSAQ